MESLFVFNTILGVIITDKYCWTRSQKSLLFTTREDLTTVGKSALIDKNQKIANLLYLIDNDPFKKKK